MSDFDKEAEREKLREKYEQDKAERQATQRMSDLLLKGATMTNSHCGTCGDPLFQQNGTTFCPSCHGNPDAVEGTNLEAQPAEESAGGTATDQGQAGTDGQGAATSTDREDTGGDSTTSTAADDRAEPQTQADASPAAESTREGESEPATASESSGDEPTTERTARTPSHESAPRRDRTESGGETTVSSRRSTPTSGSPSGDLERAHGSLVAALEKFAAEAAETDDPRYAKECLEAAREASETLDVLR